MGQPTNRAADQHQYDEVEPQMEARRRASAVTESNVEARRLDDIDVSRAPWVADLPIPAMITRLTREMFTPLDSARECLGIAATTGDGLRREQYQRLAVDRLDEVMDIVSVMHDLALVDAAQGANLDNTHGGNATFIGGHTSELESLANAHRIRLLWSIPDDLPPVLLESSGAYRVLKAFVSNAARYAPADSDVYVLVEEIEGAVRITVRDQGPGVSAEDRERIFEPFAQGEAGLAASSRGCGLGLTIARAVAHRNGGDVGVESDGTNGSAFWFTIPTLSADSIDDLIVAPLLGVIEDGDCPGVIAMQIQLSREAADRYGPDWPLMVNKRMRRSDRVVALDEDVALVIAPTDPEAIRTVEGRVRRVLCERGVREETFWIDSVGYPLPGVEPEHFRERVRSIVARGCSSRLDQQAA